MCLNKGEVRGLQQGDIMQWSGLKSVRKSFPQGVTDKRLLKIMSNMYPRGIVLRTSIRLVREPKMFTSSGYYMRTSRNQCEYVCVRTCAHIHVRAHTQPAAQFMYKEHLKVTCSQEGHLVSTGSSHSQQFHERESCLLSSLLQPSLHRMLQFWEGQRLKEKRSS